MATWPATTVADLKSRYFDESSRQIGVDETNDFIFGELHRVLRRQLFDAIGSVKDVMALPSLPPSPVLKPGADPLELLGLSGPDGLSAADLLNMLKLEAPLAVQARSPHVGFFPLNKFSTVPLIIKATRGAYNEAPGDDVRKRLMVVPRSHVMRLGVVNDPDGRRVDAVITEHGPVPVSPDNKTVQSASAARSA